MVFVDELSEPAQADLCEEFLDLFCSIPANAAFCDDPCIDTGCTPVANNGDFTVECADITEDEVLDCGDIGDELACAGGPGCIADALAGACL